MAQPPANIVDEVGIALGNLGDAATGMFTPTLRLGVTGLSRAGKTIFITALIHNLLTNSRMPGFGPLADGRLIGAQLTEHPDRGMPRFAYEQHLAALTGKEPHWPESTRRISQIRVTLKFQSGNWLTGMLGTSQLNLDIVDYPGEWLLDLPLLSLSFAEWSEQALARARRAGSAEDAKPFLEALASIDSAKPALDTDAELLASTFTQYLRASRHDGRALSTLPPGRFLLPGDMEGSPALTFAPLPTPDQAQKHNSLYAMLERRYEAYKSLLVRPFFRDHFARLDRQIVLVDALRALNAGPEAVADLETALTDVLACFRAGSPNPFIQLIARRIDRILFAATKADHLHHASHDRLEAVLNRLVANAARRAKFVGAETRSLALASIRATSEDVIEENGEKLDVIVGTPEKGERLGDEVYDGKTEIALFPGDLPEKAETVLQPDGEPVDLNFMRFMPPQKLARTEHGDPILPYIRLDRALDFLLGDWLK
ncbi:YcjX family protein [Mariluticola halotolerans]|uniref:YcjX family protein n=1 Tax=Mariluticola halotolerans TaxID=2909283 RepID=UPI0026E31E65|nr:YcjX family protein [Mariluticola halotolerans]UJQ95436.1 YcjX family protein [Mariluticola halotolerans]